MLVGVRKGSKVTIARCFWIIVIVRLVETVRYVKTMVENTSVSARSVSKARNVILTSTIVWIKTVFTRVSASTESETVHVTVKTVGLGLSVKHQEPLYVLLC